MSEFVCELFKDKDFLVVKSLKKEIGSQDFLRWMGEMVTELTAFGPEMKALIDFQSVHEMDHINFVDNDEMGTYFKETVQPKMGQKEPRAIIVSEDGPYYPIMMWCEVMDISERTKVFKTAEEAFEWLAIDDPAVFGY